MSLNNKDERENTVIQNYYDSALKNRHRFSSFNKLTGTGSGDNDVFIGN
ncbi:MAG: hypothetical protein K1X44_05810 [Alphaproteobacteria bacterium]|nr:hypothetical protein [Alphaproteobacteria bacterium]